MNIWKVIGSAECFELWAIFALFVADATLSDEHDSINKAWIWVVGDKGNVGRGWHDVSFGKVLTLEEK